MAAPASPPDVRQPQPKRRGDRRMPIGLILAGLLVLSAGSWLVRWTVDPIRASGDTFWYTRYALELTGVSPADATTEAASFTVSVTGGGSVDRWAALVATIDPRYPGIFLERPVYPATAAVLIPILGPSAMIASAVLAGLLLGIGLGAVVFLRTRSWAAAVSATVLLFALPTGSAIVLLYADGWMLLWWVASLAAASWYLETGERRALWGLVAAAILLALTKAANEVVLAAALVATCAALLAGRHRSMRRGAALAAIAVSVAIAQSVAFEVLGLPGAVASIQDLLTRHFAVPDVANPLHGLLVRDRGWVLASLRELAATLVDPLGHGPLALSIVLVVVGNVVLVLRRSLWTLPWLLGAPATILVVLLHPVSSEVPRLLAPIWIPVSIGLAILIPRIGGAVNPRRLAGGTPGAAIPP